MISSPAYVIQTARAEEIASDVRTIVRQIAPEAPMYRTFTMAGLARDSMVDVLFTMLTLGVASGLALVLGAVGLYGVLSYVVAARTREIGVRMALGAQADQVRRMVVGQGIRVVGIGIALGIGAAVLATRALGTLLFGVKAVDAGDVRGDVRVHDCDRSPCELPAGAPRIQRGSDHRAPRRVAAGIIGRRGGPT